MMKFYNQQRHDSPHVMLSEAKDLRSEPNRVPLLEILRFAQHDMNTIANLEL